MWKNDCNHSRQLPVQSYNKTPDEWYSGIFITNFELMKFINLELQLLTSQLFEVCL